MTKPLQEILKEEAESYSKQFKKSRPFASMMKDAETDYSCGFNKALSFVLERLKRANANAETNSDFADDVHVLITELEKSGGQS